MGLFIQTAIIPGCSETEARTIVKTIEEKYSCSFDELGDEDSSADDIMISDLIPDECQYAEYANGVSVLFNEDCIGYDSLAKAISREYGKTVLLLYIYDGDYWAYMLCDHGEIIDQFNPMPEYFKKLSKNEIQKLEGNAEIIAKYFQVDKAVIEKYLVCWSDITLEEKAYEDDEFGYSDWQMADFMRKLGYPYKFDEEY